MKRNKKLILKILRYVRDNATDVEPIEPPSCRTHDSATVMYHVKLCIQAGWIEEFEPRRLSDGILIRSLTFQGHEYLDENCDLN